MSRTGKKNGKIRRIMMVAATCVTALCMAVTPMAASANDTDGMSFMDFVNSSIDVQSNRIDLTGEQIDEFVASHESMIEREYPEYAGNTDQFARESADAIGEANRKLADGGFRITTDGQLLPTGRIRQRRAANFKLEWFWWGTRRTFYSDREARNFANDMDEAAIMSGTAAALAAKFPGMSGIAGLSASYATAMARSVRWAADQPGNGVVLDTKFWLQYTAVPRK